MANSRLLALFYVCVPNTPFLEIHSGFRDLVADGPLILKGPSHSRLLVQLITFGDHVYLAAGWAEFIQKNGINEGDILFCKLKQELKMSVKICSKSADTHMYVRRARNVHVSHDEVRQEDKRPHIKEKKLQYVNVPVESDDLETDLDLPARKIWSRRKRHRQYRSQVPDEDDEGDKEENNNEHEHIGNEDSSGGGDNDEEDDDDDDGDDDNNGNYRIAMFMKKLSNDSFKVTMSKSRLAGGCSIPTKYAKMFPDGKQDLMLVCPDGNKMPIMLKKAKSMLCRGWAAFRRHLALQLKDVVCFEIMTPLEWKVYIFENRKIKS